MSSHTNVSVPCRAEQELDRQIALLSAERDFWKNQARAAIGELRNIPQALTEWGECEIKDENGQVWHLQLDPKKHQVPLEDV